MTYQRITPYSFYSNGYVPFYETFSEEQFWAAHGAGRTSRG